MHSDGNMGIDSPVIIPLSLARQFLLAIRTLFVDIWRRTSTYGLVNGGMAGMVYVYIGSFVGFFAVVSSMAEIASMFVFQPLLKRRSRC